MLYKLERVQKSHDRNIFDCGNQELNNYLRLAARSADERHISRTFVACDLDSPTTILGFLTLSVRTVSEPPDNRLYKKYKHNLAAMTLARMGVDLRFQDQGLGGQLITYAIQKTVATSENVGIIGLFVDPKTPQLTNYYGKFGFEQFKPGSDKLEMWISLNDCIEVAADLPRLDDDE